MWTGELETKPAGYVPEGGFGVIANVDDEQDDEQTMQGAPAGFKKVKGMFGAKERNKKKAR